MSKLSVFEKMRKGEDFTVRNCVKCSITFQLLVPFKLQWVTIVEHLVRMKTDSVMITENAL